MQMGGFRMLTAYKRYFDFQGRASRSEYWLFALLMFLVAFGVSSGVGFLRLATGSATAGSWVYVLFGLFILGSLIPSVAVGFRRLHDTDRSAWWLLISFLPIIGSIVLIVFYCLPGTPGPNRFGPAPGMAATDLQETFA